MTKIEYLDKSWNPTHGCTPIAAGCKNCWAKRMANRQRGRNGYPADDPFGVTCRPDRLDQPLRWKKPRRIGVSFMGDLFHDDVPDDFIERVWKTMYWCQPQTGSTRPSHTFLVLTKRPARACEFTQQRRAQYHGDYINAYRNIHVGFSASTQADLNAGIKHLMQAPAAVRFLSLEPLVGPIDLTRVSITLRGPAVVSGTVLGTNGGSFSPCGASGRGLDWVVVGGESGPGARPCDLQWIEDIVGQCKAAQVACFVKQLGAKPCRGLSLIPGKRPVANEWCHFRSKKGVDPGEWPESLRVRELPDVT